MSFKHLAWKLESAFCLRGDLLEEFERALLLGVGGGEDGEGGCACCSVRRAAGVAHDGGEFSHQGGEAVRWGVVIEEFAGDFGQCGWGALGRCHRAATVTFADGNNATFAYTVSGTAQTKPITRQVFSPPGTICR